MQKTAVVCSAFVASLFSLTNLTSAQAQTAPAAALACAAPSEYTRLEHPLMRTALSLASGDPVVIVAVGSSSTFGAGASTPANSYPSRLEADLKARFPGVPIKVLNRGVNGEDAKQMLARFDETVLAEKPDLVLWQVGTNAVLRDHNLSGEAPLIREGIRRLKAAQADIVLIDSQYAPKVLAKPDINGMIELMKSTARDERVNIFHRFAVMRHWVETDRVSFETLLSPDGLHMNDWSYGCIAKLLSVAITDAMRSPAIAKVPARR